jgi:hypothetical protein
VGSAWHHQQHGDHRHPPDADRLAIPVYIRGITQEIAGTADAEEDMTDVDTTEDDDTTEDGTTTEDSDSGYESY